MVRIIPPSSSHQFSRSPYPSNGHNNSHTNNCPRDLLSQCPKKEAIFIFNTYMYFLII